MTKTIYSKFILFFCFFITTQELVAQQLPLFTQYRENQALLNPASVHTDFISQSFLTPNNAIGLSYRHQWAGIRDAPRTFTGRYEHIFYDYNMLIGGAFIKDDTGPTGITGGYFRYAYQIELGSYSFLSIGMSTGFLQYRYQSEKGVLRDPGDLTGLTNYNATFGEFTLGAFYKGEFGNDDKLYGGLSFPQLATFTITSTEEGAKANRVPHIYGLIGMYKSVSDALGGIYIEPSMWIKYAGNAPVNIDTNIRFQITENFYIGTGYAIDFADKVRGNNFHMEAGVLLYTSDISIAKIGYGFDRSITTFGPRLGATHEINLTYTWEN